MVAVACFPGIGLQVQAARQNTSAAAAQTKGYITANPPAGITAAAHLSADERRENLEFLWNAIDITYPCFTLKSINWRDVRASYEARLDSVTTDEEFFLLLFHLVNELKDTHSWLQNYKVPPLAAVGGVSIDLFAGTPFVVAVKNGSDIAKAGVTPGWALVSVDGLTPAQKMEALRPYLHAQSSERAYERVAGRHLLSGAEGSTAVVTLRSPDGRMETLTLRRAAGPVFNPPLFTVPFQLTSGRYVDVGRHPSGPGYIRIRSFDGRQDVADEFDRALDQLRDTPGLILDIRDNPGGFGQQGIVRRFLRKRTLVAISYVKNGPGEKDLDRKEMYLDPGGPWQYGGEVALLVNDVTGSAADLFACQLRSAKRVITVGTTTHGNLSGVAAFAVLPCGLVVRISNGYVADARNRPIEVNGNEPDVKVEPTISDFLSGRDPVLERAVALVARRR